eukprot:TRINITY_DN9075_c2_g1_i1.p1 TRINITY_DN9075_c2_g1~~TRINITY_DN9075_c2_g1_i1.p1  ORF type:complete len:672 (+),score=138.98 TRINITY_DN9075_c2_g1_i1:34-2049(+)
MDSESDQEYKKLELQILSSNEQMEVLDLCMKHEQAKITGWEQRLKRKHKDHESSAGKRTLSCSVGQVMLEKEDNLFEPPVIPPPKYTEFVDVTPENTSVGYSDTRVEYTHPQTRHVATEHRPRQVDTTTTTAILSTQSHSPSPKKVSPRSILGGAASRNRSVSLPAFPLPELPSSSPPFPTLLNAKEGSQETALASATPNATITVDTSALSPSFTFKGRDPLSMAQSELSSNYVTPIQGWAAAKSPVSRCTSLEHTYEASPLPAEHGGPRQWPSEAERSAEQQIRVSKRAEAEALTRMQELVEEVDELQGENEKMQAEHAKDTEELKKQVATLDEENDTLRQEALKLIEQAEEAEEREKTIKKELDGAQERAQTLEVEVTRLELRASRAEEEAQNAAAKNQQLQNELKTYTELYTAAKNKMKRDEEEMDALRATIQGMEGEMGKTKELLKSESASLRKKYDEVERGEQERARMEIETEKLNKRIEAFEAEQPAIEQMKHFIKEVSFADDVTEAKRRRAADAYVRLKVSQPTIVPDSAFPTEPLAFLSSSLQRPKPSRRSAAGSSTGIYPPGSISRESQVRPSTPRRGRSSSSIRTRSPSMHSTASHFNERPIIAEYSSTPVRRGSSPAVRPSPSPVARPSPSPAARPPSPVKHRRIASVRRARPPINSLLR